MTEAQFKTELLTLCRRFENQKAPLYTPSIDSVLTECLNEYRKAYKQTSAPDLPDKPGEWKSPFFSQVIHVSRVDQGPHAGKLKYDALNDEGAYNVLGFLVTALPRGGWERAMFIYKSALAEAIADSAACSQGFRRDRVEAIKNLLDEGICT
jgi:hypothetical protein